jgi:hypothetical protein
MHKLKRELPHLINEVEWSSYKNLHFIIKFLNRLVLISRILIHFPTSQMVAHEMDLEYTFVAWKMRNVMNSF